MWLTWHHGVLLGTGMAVSTPSQRDLPFHVLEGHRQTAWDVHKMLPGKCVCPLCGPSTRKQKVTKD